MKIIMTFLLAAGIIELNPAANFIPDLLSARQTLSTAKDRPSLTLLEFSDLHGDSENLERIAEFKKEYEAYIDDAIHLGDAVEGYYSDPNPWDLVPGARGIINIVGNHDCWKSYKVWAETDHPYDATQEDAYWKILVGKDRDNPFIDGWGVTRAKERFACYFYKDYEASKVRLVVLDCIHYTDAQHKWLEKTLAQAAEKGLCVIAAVHYPAQHGLERIDCGFSSGHDIGFTPDPGASQMERTPDAAFAAVDKFIACGGEFVCWISGHEHFDYIGRVAGHEPQIQIIVDKAGEKDDYMEEDRSRGTRNQDAFNLLTVNPTKHFVAIQRIGCSRNDKMQSKRLFCFDYRTGEVIVSE